MKKFTAKKVFAIIGIVVGSVAVFVGAVFGVMAAMGKFKTPIVYPAELVFLNNDEVVVENITYGNPDGKKPTIHYFYLEGTSSSEHEVNRKTCYIWFDKNVGSNLITLCDKNGLPLEKNSKNRYKVNCNEPIYYMINEVAANAETDGKAVIMARSENDKVQPDVPLTLWIDREVESVFVKGWGQTQTANDINTQTITLGIDIPFDFEYVVDTPLSFKPIAKESAKEIELYYVSDATADYIKVTEEEINKQNSPLNSILSFKDGKFTFKSESAGTHTFKIAIFPTYQAELDYEKSIEGIFIGNPNYHRSTEMTLTTLTVSVENIEISEVGFLGGNVVLNLYSENDYITLDGVSGVEGAKDNNLELYMKKGEEPNTIPDYLRFDEVNMNGFGGAVWSDRDAMFKTNDDLWLCEDGVLSNEKSIELTDIQIADNLKIIDYVYNTAGELKKYYCSNGVAVWDSSTDRIKLLSPGSYLNFYNKKADGSATIANFDYQATAMNSGREKSWNIICKEMPQDKENLCLGILVVNGSGEFVYDKFFKTIPVALSEIDFNYEILKNSEDLSIGFTAAETTFESATFESFVNIKNGSYNAGVFVTPKKTASTDYIVDVFENITFNIGGTYDNDGNYKYDGTNYVLVGYIGADGKFVNGVRVNSNVTKDNKTSQLFMLQLKNGYQQTIYDIFNETVLSDGKAFEINEIIELHDDDEITINSNYILNADLLSFGYYDVFNGVGAEGNVNTKHNQKLDVYQVYEKTSGHKIVISSSNNEMMDKIFNFYGIDSDSFKTNYEDNLEIGPIISDENLWIVEYEPKSCLSDDQIVIAIEIVGLGAEVNLKGLQILSGSPNQIILNASDNNSLELIDDQELAKISENYLEVVVKYESNRYTYSYKLNGIDIDEDTNIFNTTTSSPVDIGFQDEVDKKQTLDVRYDCLDKSIFNTDNLASQEDLVKKGGTTVLSVSIGDKTQYLKVVTTVNNFEISTIDNKTSFENKTNLSDMVKLTYTPADPDAEIELTTAKLVYIKDVKCISYGDGVLRAYGDEINGWTLKKSESDPDVLTIVCDADGWEFARTNQYIPLTISFVVQTVAGDKSIDLTFTSSINVSVNTEWQQEKTLYAETKVLLHSIEENTKPVFDINGIANNTKVKFNIIKSAEVHQELESQNEIVLENLTDDYIGKISIEVYVADAKTGVFGFDVKPNVIATLKDNKLVSETNYSVSNIYNLSAYDATITYGSSASALYTNKTYYTDSTYETTTQDETDYYKFTNATGTPSNLFLTIKEQGNKDPEVTFDKESEKLIVPAMEELKVEKERTIYLKYRADEYTSYQVSEDNIKIVNKYDNNITLSNTGENETLTFKALKPYNYFATVTDFDLKSITASDLNFVVSGSQFTISTIVDQILEDVEVELTFEHITNGQTLTYATTITIIPYTPNERTDLKTPYSGAGYDLLNGIYNAVDDGSENSIYNKDNENNNIQSLLITAILDEQGNDIKNNVIIGSFGGYIKGQAKANCLITFKEIVGKSKTVKIQYTITYVDGNSYTYLRDLIILNRQAIKMNYPESDKTVQNADFKFYTGYDDDAIAIMGGGDKNANGIYRLHSTELNPINFEPIMIYTEKSTLVNFKQDDVKKVVRAEVSNVAGIELGEENSLSEDVKISLIAYQNNTSGMAAYAERVTIDEFNQITLPSGASGLFGSLVFKVETASGNCAYYIIYVFSKGTSTSTINAEKNLEVIANSNVSYPYSGSLINNKVEISSTTYKELIDDKIGKTQYFNYFGRTYSSTTTSLYLYEGVATGAEFNYGDKRWKKINDDSLIEPDAHFNKIIIGLVYNDGVEIYPYGTITIYLQPDVAVSTSTPSGVSDWSYGVPNGEFTAKITASATEIICPFGTGWAAEIVSIGGVDYDGGVHTNYTTAAGKLSIGERVGADLNIRVKYSYNGTIAFVDYTYLATVIPTQEYLDAHPILVGNFNGSNFVNTINVDGNETFLGTYAGEIDVTVESVNASYDSGTLTFAQITELQTIKVKITYNDYGTNGTTRIFTFTVRAGVYVDDSSIADDSGLSNAKRKSTERYTDYETSNIGSTLQVKYKDDEGDYWVYRIGGLEIYTAEASKLQFSFGGNYRYVVGDSNEILTADNYEINGGGTLQFVNLPNDKTMDLTITVLTNGEKEYTSHKFYVNVIKTYTSLQSSYIADGADHENVVSDSKIEKLHEDLLTSSKDKMSLVGTELDTATKEYKVVDGANLVNMGFGDKNNPNYIEFSVANNANIRTYGTASNETVGIKFATVSKNTECILNMNNEAGMPECYYDYQIMANVDDDGDDLDYSTCDGICKENDPSNGTYITYSLLNDDGDRDADATKPFTSRRYIIGKMKDLKNENIFSIKKLFIDGTNFMIDDEDQKKIIEGGYYKGVDPETKAFGGYEDGVQYILNNGDYTFYITYDNVSKNIELIVVRTSGNISEFILTLNAGGVNGESTLIEGLKIVLTNIYVVSNYSSQNDTTIYADYLIDLKDKISEHGVPDGTSLEYALMDSSYLLDGIKHTISAGDNDNNLFNFNADDKKIQTRPVGSDVDAEIWFEISNADGYVVGHVLYRFYVYLNMQFVVNGNELVVGEDNLQTNFVLDMMDKDETTNTRTNKTFPHVVYFSDEDDITGNYDTSNDRYSVLIYELYRLKLQGTGSSIKINKNNVVIEMNSPGLEGIVTLHSTNKTLTFHKDYEGDIELNLIVRTDNGTYSAVWTITVTSVVSLQNASKNPDIGYITYNALPFTSGTTVNMIYNSATTGLGVGIVMGKEMNFNNLWVPDDIAVEYEYKITTVNNETSTKTNKELFDMSVDNVAYQGQGSGSGYISTISFNTILPSVPSTTESEEQAYFVTYKVYVEYLGLAYNNSMTDENKQTVKVFYITYKVINYMSVSVYGVGDPSSASINVDNLEGDKLLDLFHFEQLSRQVGIEGKTGYQAKGHYKLVYTDGKIKLYVDSVVKEYTSDDGEYRKFAGDYKYDITTNKLLDKDDNLLCEDWDITPNYQNEDNNPKIYSVFSSNFTNIFDYKEFIDSYLNVENGVKLGDEGFKLEEIVTGSGRYGIDLSAFETNKFNNKLEVDLTLNEGGVTTLTIPAYSAANTTGFRLYTTKEIKAITNGGAGYELSTLFLPTYFEPTAEGVAAGVTMSTSIIGVGNPDISWVTSDSTVTITKDISDSTPYAKIKIPSGSDVTTYNVKKVTYNAGSSSLYNLTQDFYYIDKEVYMPDYNTVGIETTRFKITYNPDASGNITMNLDKTVKRLHMNDGELKIDYNLSANDITARIVNSVEGVNYDDTNKKIVVNKNTLNRYKKQNPNKKNYETVQIVLTAGSTNMLCDLAFALPDYPFVEVNQGTSEFMIYEDDETIVGLHIPVVSGGSTIYEELTSDNKADVTSIIETDLGDYVWSYDSGKITLNTDEINTYFTVNTSETKLEIYCQLTTNEGKTLDFVIAVNKDIPTS